MVGLILRLRWIAAIVVLFCLINSLAFIAIGVLRAIEGYRVLFAGTPWPAEHGPGLELAKSLDSFLLAMVFFVFSIGITTLFLARVQDPALESVPAWMKARSLGDLKFMLWEAILAVLVVSSVEGLVTGSVDRSWTALVVPLATLILAVGLFISRKAHE